MIDGTDAPGQQGFDFIVSVTAGKTGNASNSVIEGLDIVNFHYNPATLSGGTAIIVDPGVTGVTIKGNYIGVGPNGTTVEGNDNAGVFLSSSNNTVGGTTAADRNVIAGNGLGGVIISGGYTVPFVGTVVPPAANNLIEGNYIGTDATGDTAIPNLIGVGIGGGTGTTVGGTTAAAANVISGNTTYGVGLTNSTAPLGSPISLSATTTNNLIEGNLIGVDATDSKAIPNVSDGVQIDGADHTTVGGTTAATGNTIANNGGSGVVIQNTGATNNLVEGNTIASNMAAGVLIQNGAADNTVGGVVSGSVNSITGNQANGVAIGSSATDSSTVGNAIEGNAITANTGLGIDLGNDGVTSNGTNHASPNDLQNYPVLTTATLNAGATTIVGTFDQANETNTTLRLEFFADPGDSSNHGEGAVFLGSTSVTTNSSGHADFSVSGLATVPTGDKVSADGHGHEFVGHGSHGRRYLRVRPRYHGREHDDWDHDGASWPAFPLGRRLGRRCS